MGIRIHKILGYGLDDVEFDGENWKVTDSRFAEDGYLNVDWEERENIFTDEGFDEYLSNIVENENEEDGLWSGLGILRNLRQQAKDEEDKWSKKGRYSNKDSISNCVVHEPEFGMSNVMVFTPPVFGKNWQRYDDIIDYYEPSHHDVDGGIDTGITLLNRSIYPFDGYVDCRTMPPKRLNHLEWRLYVDSIHSQEYKDVFAESARETMDFKDVEEMHKMVRPMVPDELTVLLKYLKVFKDEADIHTLKPMLYWYWG